MNGKFQEKYGSAWKDMDSDTRQMILMSEIFDLREQEAQDKQELKDQIVSNRLAVMDAFKVYSAACKVVEKHQVYWTLALWVGSPFALAVLGIVIKIIFRL